MKTKLLLLCVFTAMHATVLAQSIISGKVRDAAGNEPLPGIQVKIKNTLSGTLTDKDGSFTLAVDAFPVSIIFSSVGYQPVEKIVSDANGLQLDVVMQEQIVLMDEMVVSASRVEESSLRSAVTIEKLDALDIRQSAAANFYDALANLKGVDVVSSSINFTSMNMRGFTTPTNNRTVQLLDGMDSQIPTLNLSAGNLFGAIELDIESIEVLPGPSSALYGPNAFNGVISQTTKNPFDYQGLSAMAKLGVNHINDSNLDTEGRGPVGPGSAQPMYEAALRYAKAFNNKFAFKIALSYAQAEDWHGTSFRDRAESVRPAGFSFNPGADLIFASGDEAATSLGLVKFALAANPTFQNSPLFPLRNFLPNHTVSRTPYNESTFADYDAYSAKVNASIHYRFHNKLEMSYMFNYGMASSVLNAAQRTPANDFTLQQHKVELKAKNYFVRGYITRPDAGKTYSGDLTGVLINSAWKPNSQWFQEYAIAYLTNVAGQISQPGYDPTSVQAQEAAHNFARSVADQGRFLPGSVEFENAKKSVISKTLPTGSAIKDNSVLYHAEGQYDFTHLLDFVSLQAGLSFRMFDLNSKGTIFADTVGNNLTVSEVGAYVQATKDLIENKLKATASLRYDKNSNFDAQLNPRVAIVYSPVQNQNLRFSYQSGFRTPTLQNVHQDFFAGSQRLLGGLSKYADAYNAFENAYTLASVQRFVAAVTASGTPTAIADPANLSLLVPVQKFKSIVPEEVQTFEVGYKSLINDNLMIDLAYYYNQYQNFIVQKAIRKSSAPITATNPLAAQTLLSANTTPGQENTFSINTNVDEQISSQGLAAGFEYTLFRGYKLAANYNWNKLNEELGEGVNTDFNTPEHKFNVSINNRKLTDKLGFNVTYRWQEAFEWTSTFARGLVPTVGTVDAQVSYNLNSLKSLVKIGGSNVFNERYFLNYGGPTIGATYYVSVTVTP
jgi:iron complex outermembrane recepter protein